MQVKDKYLEKINFLIIVLILCFSQKLFAENIYEKVFDYNDNLKNSAANFIQTNTNDIQEGLIFFGDKRIKITYTKPKKITIILSDKKGVYIDHELKETNFFATKNSYVKFFFNVFYNKKYLESLNVAESYHQIEISENIKLDNILHNIKLIYENEPINLRRLEITSNNEKTQMGFFNYRKKQNFKKKFFSMIDPYLN